MILFVIFHLIIVGKCNRAGLVVKILQTAVKFPECQPAIVENILNIFEVTNPDRHHEIINLILHVRTYSVIFNLILEIPRKDICPHSKRSRSVNDTIFIKF
jgi:hypothetical protein